MTAMHSASMFLALAGVLACIATPALAQQAAPRSEEQVQRLLRGATAKTKGEAAAISQVVDEASTSLNEQSKAGRSKGKSSAESVSQSIANSTSELLGASGSYGSVGMPSNAFGSSALAGAGSTPTKEDLRRQYQQTCGGVQKPAIAAMCAGMAVMVESVNDSNLPGSGKASSSAASSTAFGSSALGVTGSSPTKEDLRRQYQQTCGRGSNKPAIAAMCVGMAAMVESVNETNLESSRNTDSGSLAASGGSKSAARSGGASSFSSGGSSALARRSAGPNNCPVTLAHLDSKLPRYDNPQLTSLRRTILETNVLDSLKEMKAQYGSSFSLEGAAKAAMQQSQEFEAGLSQTEECIRQSSSDAEAVMASLRSGRAGGRGYVGLNATCQQAYIAAYYGVVANREMAVITACLARNRQ